MEYREYFVYTLKCALGYGKTMLITSKPKAST